MFTNLVESPKCKTKQMFCILVEKSPKIALHFGKNPQMQNYLGGEDMEL
jgi:hypothetical protein